jgi:flagellar biosynthetic protein FliR
VQLLPLEATGFLILFARVGAILMLLPVFSEEAIPSRIRLLVALGTSVGLWGLIGGQTLPYATDVAHLPVIIIAELLTGLALGMIMRIMFFAAAMAGSLISVQVGMTSAIVSDPSQGGSASLLSRLVGMAAILMCLSLSVHHLWIASIVRSYSVLPVGGIPRAGDFAALALHVTTRSTMLGLGLAAPLIVYGVVFNVALGLAARVAPAIQIFFMAQPLNLILGLALLTAIGGTLLTSFAQSMAEWLNSGWS